MNEITITITVRLPDGVVPDVQYGEVAPVVTQALHALEQPVADEPPHVAQTFAPFAPGQSWPPGECPVHHKPFKDGQYGPFCSAQGGNGPLNKKGYCDLKPGMQFNGKQIPVAA